MMETEHGIPQKDERDEFFHDLVGVSRGASVTVLGLRKTYRTFVPS